MARNFIISSNSEINFEINYTVKSNDNLTSVECSLHVDVEDFECPELDYTFSANSKAVIDLYPLTNYVKMVEFEGTTFSIISTPPDNIPVGENPVQYTLIVPETINSNIIL